MKNTKSQGNYAENIAVSFLKQRNYQIIARNYSHKKGEVDIIVYDSRRQEIVFVEVRSKWLYEMENIYNPLSIIPEDSVNSRKLKKIEKTAWLFLEKEPELWEPYFRDLAPYTFPEWRIDLISVIIIRSIKKVKLKHYKYVTI